MLSPLRTGALAVTGRGGAKGIEGGRKVVLSSRGRCVERRRERAMSNGRLSGARLGRMHDVIAGHAERGEAPGTVRSPAPS
jgi:hypothetical protein